MPSRKNYMTGPRDGEDRTTEFPGINGNSQYENFSTDIGNLHCVKCGETIENGQLAFVMNFGCESSKHPLHAVLRMTGLAWHAGGTVNGRPTPKCLNVKDLPGCGEREGIEEEFSRAFLPQPQSRMTH